MALFGKNKKANQKSKSFSREDPKKVLNAESPFVVKEAYSAIRTNLLFMQKGEKCPVFVITSPTANNGKLRTAFRRSLQGLRIISPFQKRRSKISPS